MILKGKSAKIVLAALAMSLVANLFVVSFVAGEWSGANTRPASLGQILPYPESIRADVRKELRDNRAILAPALRRVREARIAMYEAARAPSLDETALKAAMAEMRSATTALQEISQDALAKALASATAEERAAIRRPSAFNLRDE